MCLYFPNAVVFSLPFLKDCPQSESDFSTTLVCQISNRKYVRKSKIVSWIGAFSLKMAGNKFLEIPKKSTKFFSLGPTQNPLVVTPCGFDPHHRLTKQPGTAACICGGSGLLLYLFTLQLSTCRYGFLECLMAFCCNRVRRKWRCRCAQWWHPRGWHRGNPRSCPWKGYPF